MDLILPRLSQCLISTPPGGEVSWVLSYKQYRVVMYRSIQSFNMPPPAYLGLLTPLPSQGGGNLIIRVFQGVGNLNCTLDFMWNLWRGEISWGTRCQRIFVEKTVPFGQLVARKGLKQALCRIWRYLYFKIFNIGFRLWIYECIKLFLQWNTIPIPAIQ